MQAGRYRVENRALSRTRAPHADLSGTRASGVGAESLQCRVAASKDQLSSYVLVAQLLCGDLCAWLRVIR